MKPAGSANAAARSVILSHHKVMGVRQFRSFERNPETHSRGGPRRNGVGFDVYPYTAGASMLSESIRKSPRARS